MSATIQLSNYAYGKTGVRLVKVERHENGRHDLKDIDVSIQVFGCFETSYSQGDNRCVLPTDTMKNTVYALARQKPLGEIEEFGVRLADHFLGRNSHFSRVRIGISEKLWQRIGKDSQAQGSAFQAAGEESRNAVIDSTREEIRIQSGIADLLVLKTSRSAFENFLRDEYTTLRDAQDRLLCSRVKAEWLCSSSIQDFGATWSAVRNTLLDCFATHDSRSVQHTLYAMGAAVLEQHHDVSEIRLSMSNRHCLPVDLSAFHLENPNEVFMPVEEPSGLMEATLKRQD